VSDSSSAERGSRPGVSDSSSAERGSRPGVSDSSSAERGSRPEVSDGTVREGRSQRAVWWRTMGWRYVVAVVALVFALFPILWVFSASVNATGTLSGQTLIPARTTWANYTQLFDGSVPFGRWFANTMIVAGTAAVLTVFLCALGAFAFSRLRFRGRRTGLLTLLLVQMFPQLLAVVALFLLMLRIGEIFPAFGLGTRVGLIAIYLGGALGINTWLMKGFFDTIPSDLDESAKVDGATHAQVFFRIILPLATPVLAVIGLLSFVFSVNEFLIASVILTNEQDYTLSVGLARFIGERFDRRWGPFAAGTILGGIPVIVLFGFLQRYIVSGLTSGSVKG
jgi:arabinogalactan oligomer / maltooligosaccharide transport system permease protein